MAEKVIRAEDLKRVIDGLDPRRVVLSYDRDSDTLIAHFYGRGIPGVSVPVETSGDWMLRVHRETRTPIGFQIENFLERAVVEHPHLYAVLEFAELRGITLEEIEEHRHANQGPLSAIQELATEFESLYSTAAD